MPAHALVDDVAAAEVTVDALTRVWRNESWRSWDPFDALASPWLSQIPDGTPLLRQLAIQTVKRLPINVRPVVRVPRLRHIKGLALLVSAMARMHTASGWAPADEIVSELVPELIGRATYGPAGAGWGYDFDVRTRWGAYRTGEPNAIATAFVTNALLDAEAAGLADVDGGLLAAVRAFIVDALFVEDGGGGGYFAYFPGSRSEIHNASLLLAATVARIGRGDADAGATARAAIEHGVAAQSVDGSWPYGAGDSLGWIDGFHTAYNLVALNSWMRSTGSNEFRLHLRRGLSFYRTALVDPDAAPRATVTSRYPVEAHAAGSALWVLAEVDPAPENLSLAGRILSWALEHLRRDDGRFVYQKHRHWTNRVPYLRWSDGHMLLGLSAFINAVHNGSQ
jgi:hypothetical protein